MTDPQEHAQSDAPASHQAGDHALPVGPLQPVAEGSSSGPTENQDHDPLQVLLQAGAALETLQQRFSELQKRQSELAAERTQLNADRDAFESRAQDFAEQVARDRTTQREITAELDERRQQLQQLKQELDHERTELSEGRSDLESARKRMQDAFNEELDREKEALQRHRETLDQERERLVERTELLETQHGERMQQIEKTLQTERDGMRETVRKELSAEIDQLHRERQEWDTHKERQLREIQQQTEDLQQQRELFGEQLETEQQRLRDEIEKRRQMLLSEQNNLQRRYRFQFEHLARAREDFEEELRELRREQQQFRSERRYFEELHRLRFGQLQRLRTALSQREASLQREQKVVDRNRVSSELDLKRQQERLQEHQSSVMQNLESRSRGLHKAEQASAETAQRVERRLQHVNQMRTELDSKQRDILEQRLILEELQMNAKGVDEQSPEYQQARSSVEAFFEQLHRHLRTERERLEQKASELSAKQELFRKDRDELQQWFVAKEKELATSTPEEPDTVLQAKAADLQEQLTKTRQQWHAERKESENTIRQLLEQIAAHESGAFQKQRPAPERPEDEQRTAA